MFKKNNFSQISGITKNKINTNPFSLKAFSLKRKPQDHAQKSSHNLVYSIILIYMFYLMTTTKLFPEIVTLQKEHTALFILSKKMFIKK